MDRLTLTEPQRAQIIKALSDVRNDNGTFDVDIEFDGFTVNANGTLDIYGYFEDHYYSGTGAWIETSRHAEITLTAKDEGGAQYELDSEFAADYLNKK